MAKFLKELWGIVAMGSGGEIGFRGDMPWHLPEDLRHFKELTLGHPVIMGRATWESLPKRPLPGRRNIVLTRTPGYEAPGAEIARDLDGALEMCAATGQHAPTPVIIGGGSVYAQALPRLTKLFVTRIYADFPEADTFFTGLSGMRLTHASEPLTSRTGLTYRFETYESGDNQ